MINRTISGTTDTFAAVVRVPGDKSLSHRALLFAGMAEGDSLVTGLGTGLDIGNTASALKALGVEIHGEEVRSPGIRRWRTPAEPIDCGNSGTTMRLLAGALSTSGTQAVLVGDPSLSKRTMARLEMPLRSLGGLIDTSDGYPPISVGGVAVSHGTDVIVEHASAQVRSAFSLAALSADAPSTIDSPAGFRDHTERWLSAIGLGEWIDSTKFRVLPGSIPPARFDVPGDPSSAAFLWSAAAISPGSVVLTPEISLNPGRLGFLQILETMGAKTEVMVTASTGGDPVGDVRVEGSSLRGATIAGDLVASALDELPLVAVLGTYAEGITEVRDAAELRVKETDRIEAVESMLTALDGGVVTRQDGFDIIGTGFLSGGSVDTHGDHRVAMAAAIAATRANGPVEIVNSEVTSISWPGFYDILEGLWS
jgi:3-phosphoshikimate 1-carboxyvinyltransferase